MLGALGMTGAKRYADLYTLLSVAKPGVNRRRSLPGAAFGASRLIIHGGRVLPPHPPPKVKSSKRGYIALTDAALLIVAKEKGDFAKYELRNVAVEKQTFWGTARDHLVLGGATNGIDGANIGAIRSDLIFGQRFAESAAREAA